MTEHYLKLLQDVSPEVTRGERTAGEILFPSGLVFPPYLQFRAVVLDRQTVWNEFFPRSAGGGFVRTHHAEPMVESGREVVKTNLLAVDTNVGEVVLRLAGFQRRSVIDLLLQFDRYVGTTIFLWSGKFTAVVGGLPEQIVYRWCWHE